MLVTVIGQTGLALSCNLPYVTIYLHVSTANKSRVTISIRNAAGR